MSHVRLLSSISLKTSKKDVISKRYKYMTKELNAFQEQFFNRDIEILTNKLKKFFDEHNDSPFPVVAHIIPPQDLSDAKPFINALNVFSGVEFIDTEIHHIQHNRIILFHNIPPPSDIPRILKVEKCFEYDLMFQLFIQEVLMFLFRHGISPETNILSKLRSIVHDRYPSFTFLFTILRQSIFEFFYERNDDELHEILDFNDYSGLESLLTGVPSTHMKIRLRNDMLRILSSCLIELGMSPFIFMGMDSYHSFISSETYLFLMKSLSEKGDEFLLNILKKVGGKLSTLPDAPPDISDTDAPIKSRTERARKLVSTSYKGICKVLDMTCQCLFQQFERNSINYMRVVMNATFNPRKAIKESLLDPNNKTDTAIAFKILIDGDKIIGAADWMKSFQAKLSNELGYDVDKSVALSKFQVAVSELGYLGFTDQRLRKNGGFKHLYRV